MKFISCALLSAIVLPLSAVRADTDVEDLSLAWSVNNHDHPYNELLEFEFLAGEIIDSISFNLTGIINPTNVGELGGSWASDAEIHVRSSDGAIDFIWRPWPDIHTPGTTTPAVKTFSAVSGLPWTVPHGGADLIIELFESFDDDPEEVDGFYAAGSSVTLSVSSHPDSDHDGMPDTWEEAHGLIVGVDDSLLDPDGDGIPNLLEYAFVSDPSVFSTGVAPVGSIIDDHLNFTYIRHKNEIDVLYIPQVSHNLTNWVSGPSAIEEVTVVDRDDQTEWVTVREIEPASAHPKGYMRLKVQHVP